jgi:hypothetical protein
VVVDAQPPGDVAGERGDVVHVVVQMRFAFAEHLQQGRAGLTVGELAALSLTAIHPLIDELQRADRVRRIVRQSRRAVGAGHGAATTLALGE